METPEVNLKSISSPADATTDALAEIATVVGLSEDDRCRILEAVQAALRDRFLTTIEQAIHAIAAWPHSDNMIRAKRYSRSWHHAVVQVLKIELPKELRKLKEPDEQAR